MASLDEVADAASHHGGAVRLCLRGDLAREHSRLNTQLVAARKDSSDADVAALAAEVSALEAQMRADATEFVFQAVGKPAWKKLEGDNPPTEAQLEADPNARYDPEAFALAAIAASMVEPEGATPASVEKLVEKLTDTQFEILWMACLEANQGVSGLGESRAASAVLRSLRPSSEAPAPTAPAEASSSDES